MQITNILLGIKTHKGRVSLVPSLNSKLIGKISIISEESFRYTSEQSKSLIMTIKRSLPGQANLIIRAKPTISVTKKPLEVRMGKGKGNIFTKVARIRPNTVIIEINNLNVDIPINKYFLALKSATSKLPIKTSILKSVKLFVLKLVNRVDLKSTVLLLEGSSPSEKKRIWY